MKTNKGFIDLISLLTLAVLVAGVAITSYAVRESQETRKYAREIIDAPYPIETQAATPEQPQATEVPPAADPTVEAYLCDIMGMCDKPIPTNPPHTPSPNTGIGMGSFIPPTIDFPAGLPCADGLYPREHERNICPEYYPSPQPTIITQVPPSVPTGGPVPTSASDLCSGVVCDPGQYCVRETGECRLIIDVPTSTPYIPPFQPTVISTQVPQPTTAPTIACDPSDYGCRHLSPFPTDFIMPPTATVPPEAPTSPPTAVPTTIPTQPPDSEVRYVLKTPTPEWLPTVLPGLLAQLSIVPTLLPNDTIAPVSPVIPIPTTEPTSAPVSAPLGCDYVSWLPWCPQPTDVPKSPTSIFCNNAIKIGCSPTAVPTQVPLPTASSTSISPAIPYPTVDEQGYKDCLKSKQFDEAICAGVYGKPGENGPRPTLSYDECEKYFPGTCALPPSPEPTIPEDVLPLPPLKAGENLIINCSNPSPLQKEFCNLAKSIITPAPRKCDPRYSSNCDETVPTSIPTTAISENLTVGTGMETPASTSVPEAVPTAAPTQANQTAYTGCMSYALIKEERDACETNFGIPITPAPTISYPLTATLLITPYPGSGIGATVPGGTTTVTFDTNQMQANQEAYNTWCSNNSDACQKQQITNTQQALLVGMAAPIIVGGVAVGIYTAPVWGPAAASAVTYASVYGSNLVSSIPAGVQVGLTAGGLGLTAAACQSGDQNACQAAFLAGSSYLGELQAPLVNLPAKGNQSNADKLEQYIQDGLASIKNGNYQGAIEHFNNGSFYPTVGLSYEGETAITLQRNISPDETQVLKNIARQQAWHSEFTPDPMNSRTGTIKIAYIDTKSVSNGATEKIIIPPPLLQNAALVSAEEPCHALQCLRGGPIAGNPDSELDVALFFQQNGVPLTPEFIARGRQSLIIPPTSVDLLAQSLTNLGAPVGPVDQYGDIMTTGDAVNKFWASTQPQGFLPVPVMKNINVSIKGQGTGTQMVTTWETAMQNMGYNNVGITNIQPDSRTVNFWTKLGYQYDPSFGVGPNYLWTKQLK